MRLRRLLLAGAALCGGAAGAAPELELASLRDMSLSDMLAVDIGTGTSKFVHQAPAVAYVLGADDIRRLGARNLLEVLQSVPGFFLYNVRAVVNEPVADLRGAFSERGGQILFMLDGRPLRLIDSVILPEVLRLPVHLVERIEVVRGPVSALYGADALTGAVNIISKKHPDEAGVSVGSFGQHDLWFGKSGSAGPLDWALDANQALSREQLRADLAQRSVLQSFERDYRAVTLRAAAGPWSAMFWGMTSSKDEAASPPGPASRIVNTSWHRHVELAYTGQLDADTGLKASVLHTRFEHAVEAAAGAALPPPPPGLTAGPSGEEHQGADLTLTRALPQAHRLRASLGLTRDQRARGEQAPAPRYDARTGRYLVLQDEYAFAPDWELTLGWRIDHFSDFGAVRNPRLGLVWNTSARLTSKLMFGQAFHPPVFAGNRPAPGQLAPLEQIRNLELAFDFRPDEQWRGALNLYRYRARDLVVAGGPDALPSNLDGRGCELELSWLASPALRFESSASLASVEDERSAAQVPFTPKRSAKLGLDWTIVPRWALNLRWEGYWQRDRPAADPAAPFGRLSLANANLRHDLGAGRSLSAGVRNLFNQRGPVPILNRSGSDQLQLPERNFLVQLEQRF